MSGARNAPGEFARRLVLWQRQHGRHGLPWQASRDPYLVWLSEVMLQQTQVSTVLDYFPRFLARFPDMHSLAEASADDVMALWSGLGYYSRARNLHRCAQVVVAEHGGVFPASAEALQQLPGIGASTAAAIAAFCHGERVSILDGNVRRVLTRVMAFDGDVSRSDVQKQLWSLAQAMLPVAASADDMAAYTQGLMDLGATLCTRSKPACERCPMSDICAGRASGEPTRFPVKTRKLKRRQESWWLALVTVANEVGELCVWLERRPSSGIWSGLFCTPVLPDEAALLALHPRAEQIAHHGPVVVHNLTHRELRLHPVVLPLDTPREWAVGREGQWVPVSALAAWGLPAPLRPLLADLSVAV